jgi:fructokinase
MRALVYLGHRRLALEDRPIPRVCAPDDVLVRVIGTGICGTDRKILLGSFPARIGVVLGHESVGVVADVGTAVKSVVEGDRVVVNPTSYCGQCVRCLRGMTSFCRKKVGHEVGADYDGTFADYVLLSERFVHRVPVAMSFERAVMIEPLACVLNNLGAAPVGFDDVVVVIGGGPIGFLCGTVADKWARRTVILESDPYRLAMARAALSHVVDAGPEDQVDAILEAAGGERPSVVIDTTGTGLESALGLVDDGGCVVVMGFDGNYRAAVSPLYLTNHGIRVVGAGDYPAQVFPVAVDMASNIDLDQLVTHQFPLEQYSEAFDTLGGVVAGPEIVQSYTAMKVVLRSDLA